MLSLHPPRCRPGLRYSVLALRTLTAGRNASRSSRISRLHAQQHGWAGKSLEKGDSWLAVGHPRLCRRNSHHTSYIDRPLGAGELASAEAIIDDIRERDGEADIVQDDQRPLLRRSYVLPKKTISSRHSSGDRYAGGRDGVQRVLTPSAVLTDALRDAGFEASLPYQARNKEDLSYRSYRSPAPGTLPLQKEWTYTALEDPSLPSILAAYIRAAAREPPAGPALGSDELVQVFTERNLGFLRERHFDVEDVISWSWIVTAQTSELAATRLLMLANSTSDPAKHARNKAPMFLLMYLLRRRDITASSFRLLLIHAWNVLQNVHHPRWTIDFTRQGFVPQKTQWNSKFRGSGNHPEVDDATFARLHVRLLRHARLYWPEAIDSVISAMTSFHVELTKVEALDSPVSSRLTFYYNRMLSLAGLPTPKSPFNTVYANQRAQFRLLQRMNDFQPPIAINREGYRAVVEVQLRHRKTRREREWALLKSKAWPPWKEDRYGLDADKGLEYGISKAKQTLGRALEAGYNPLSWEHAAGILSGWDTDDSPTIQTRALLAGRRSDQRPGLESTRHLLPTQSDSDKSASTGTQPPSDKAAESEPQDSSAVWATRIQATRTLDEAWACFLAFEDARMPWSPIVCFAMFQKLVFARLKSSQKKAHPAEDDYGVSDSVKLTPGDTLDIWSTSQNPRERPYLRKPPPDEHEFMADILRHGVPLNGRFLAFSLQHAENLGVGWQYLRNSEIDPKAVNMLLGEVMPQAEVLNHALTPQILAAYIRLLCRTKGKVHHRRRPLLKVFRSLSMDHGVQPHNTLLQAYRLLRVSKMRYRPPWYDLLAALAARGAKIRDYDALTPSSDEKLHDIAAWQAMLDLLLDMDAHGVDLDFDGFHIFCVGLEKAIFAARHASIRTRSSSSEVESGERGNGGREHDQKGPPLGELLSATQDFDGNGGNDSHKNDHAAAKRKLHQKRIDDVLEEGASQLKSLFLRIASARTASLDESNSNNNSNIDFFLPATMDEAFTHTQAGQPGKQKPNEPKSPKPQSHNLDPSFLLPRLLDVPKAADLHAFIRVLGFAGDRRGIVALLRWMAWFAPEIGVRSNEMRNGAVMTRRTLVAARVMLERWWEDPEVPDDEVSNLENSTLQPTSESGRGRGREGGSESQREDGSRGEKLRLLQQARDIIDTVESWGGWPVDGECDEYIRVGRFV